MSSFTCRLEDISPKQRTLLVNAHNGQRTLDCSPETSRAVLSLKNIADPCGIQVTLQMDGEAKYSISGLGVIQAAGAAKARDALNQILADAGVIRKDESGLAFTADETLTILQNLPVPRIQIFLRHIEARDTSVSLDSTHYPATRETTERLKRLSGFLAGDGRNVSVEFTFDNGKPEISAIHAGMLSTDPSALNRLSELLEQKSGHKKRDPIDVSFTPEETQALLEALPPMGHRVEH